MVIGKQGLKEGDHKEGIRITFNEELCNACCICTEFCARGVLARNDLGRPAVVRLDRCTECRICELMCPELAIIVSQGSSLIHENGNKIHIDAG